MIDLKGNEISDDILFQVVESVTDTFLKMPAMAVSPPPAPLEEESWTGTISVTGDSTAHSP